MRSTALRTEEGSLFHISIAHSSISEHASQQKAWTRLCLFLCPLPPPPPQHSRLAKYRWARPRAGGVTTRGWEELCLPALGLSPLGTSSGFQLLELCRISKNSKLKVNIFKGIKNADKMQLLHSEKQLRGLPLRQQPSSPSWVPTRGCLDLLFPFPLHKGEVLQDPGLQGTPTVTSL